MAPTMKSFVADRNRASAIPEKSTASLAALKVQVGSSKQNQESAPRASSTLQQNTVDQTTQPWNNGEDVYDDFNADNFYDDLNDMNQTFGDTVPPPADGFAYQAGNIHDSNGDANATVDAPKESWTAQDHQQMANADFRYVYTDGDSYPDTTSGVLSEQGDAPAQGIDAGQTSWHQAVQHSMFRQPGQPSQPINSFSRPTEPSVPAFAFGMRNGANNVRPVSNNQQQQPQFQDHRTQFQPRLLQPVAAAVSYDPQQSLAMSTSFNTQQQIRSPVERRRTSEPRATTIRRSHTPDTNKVNEPPSAATAVPHGHTPDTNTFNDLDFAPSALHAMRYSTLRDQPFDQDPKSSDDEPSLQADLSLAQRLETAAGTSFDDRSVILESLDITEWEEAGDWIAEELSKVMTEIIAVRRRKRATAKKFEAEVDQWYQDTTTKQKAADDALKVMRSRGQDLLGGMATK